MPEIATEGLINVIKSKAAPAYLLFKKSIEE